jgi:predicted HNH restriction endonuclease
MSNSRIPESELVLPSLFFMEINGGHITTEELIPKLRELMKPSGEDLEILTGRTDDKFSQKVRNLKAHNTFKRLEYAEYKNSIFYLTTSGKAYLEQNRDVLNYLLISDFVYPDIVESLKQIINVKHKKTVQVFDENLIIQEGIKEITEKEIYIRSKKLRDYSLTYYSENGGLNCRCCGFDFSLFYGKEIGDDFIEMHHVKPIFQYKGEDLIQTIKNAVLNIIPLCSNCHRMIHRHRRQPLRIDELINYVKKNGLTRKL